MSDRRTSGGPTRGDAHDRERDAFPLPPFVRSRVDEAVERVTADGFDVARSAGEEITCLGVRVEGARALEAEAFTDVVARAYDALRRVAHATDDRTFVRFWNAIPGIHDRLDDGRIDRYMAFNAGRHRAMRGWYDDLAAHVPAATGVGVEGDALVIRALTTRAGAVAIQNGRQRPATAYSARYGPVPPCFARATLSTFEGRPTLWVSGTAAILGEDSAHANDLDAQLALTCEHLVGVVAAAGLVARGREVSSYRSLRVYLPDDAGRAIFMQYLAAMFPAAGPIEFVRAQLCRRELLVEIEGVASGETGKDHDVERR